MEALPSLVSGRHFVFFLVLFLCCFVSVLTNKFIHSFIQNDSSKENNNQKIKKTNDNTIKYN